MKNYERESTIKKSMITLGTMMAMILLLVGIFAPSACAAEKDTGNKEKAIRTIIVYCDGADSEEKSAVASDLLVEAMKAKFDNQKIRYIVMTGGAKEWHMEAKYLKDQDGKTISGISNEYNQIWELYSAADTGDGYMKLLDGDGGVSDGSASHLSKDELMKEPATLKGFINYAREYAPAEKYDLILFDHGSGPGHGYGLDDHDTVNPKEKMPVKKIIQAISESDVVTNEGKFDIIDFDCCMMGNFETALALSDYTEYYLGSCDVNPIFTLDYTALLDFLGKNPTMDSKTFGREFVNNFVDYYEKNPDKASIGNAVKFSMVDTRKLKESGLIEKMQVIARTLRNEATKKNFYDEIRSSEDDFEFFYPNLQDMGTLVEQLGINLEETDWKDPELKNAYTKTAIEIQKILSNQDIIYSKHTGYSKVEDVIFGRNANGDLEVRANKIPSGGLNIFFNCRPEGEVTKEVVCYIDAMKSLDADLKDDRVREFLSVYRQAIIDYELIYDTGIAVSKLAEDGCAVKDINFNKVKEYYQKHDKETWKLISKILSNSDRDTEKWLGQIINVQKKEALNPKNITVKKEKQQYRVDIRNTPKRAIDVPKYVLSAKPKTAINEYLAIDPVMVYYGTSVAAEEDTSSTSSFEDFMASRNSSYMIPKYNGKWYAVKDSKGVRHIASMAMDGLVYAQFLFEDGTGETGLLQFDKDGNSKSIYINGNTKPIDLGSFSETVKVTLLNNPEGVSGPISDEFDIKKKNAKLIEVPFSKAGITSISAKLSILDMYGVEHDITALMKQADKNQKTSIKKVKVSGIKAKTWNGKSLKQNPVVGLSGKTLKKGTDYTVSYKDNKNVGMAKLIIKGKGSYTGTITKTFRINPKGTSIKHLKKAKKAVKVKWKKQSVRMSKSRISGYQIQLATDNRFTRNKKTVTVKGYKKASKKIRKLKGGKKYYVHIRTYKTIGKTKFYSPWSEVKSVK